MRTSHAAVEKCFPLLSSHLAEPKITIVNRDKYSPLKFINQFGDDRYVTA